MKGIAGGLSASLSNTSIISLPCSPSLLPHFPFLSTLRRKPIIFNLTLSSSPFPFQYRQPLQPSTAVHMSSSSSTLPSSDPKNFSVLFVCLGNICRSPAAEGVFRDIVSRKGLLPKFTIDSAGTIDYHEGNEADPRMRAAAKRRGIVITSISRPIRPSDFIDFDLILAMDMQNRDDIFEAFNRWKQRDSLPHDAYKKVRVMCSYCKRHKETEVPDPYYGGPQGFEQVLDILEDACESLLDDILAENVHLSNS
ncbi:hypothetical protein AAC387_Pa12g0528 [Persea americana]|eukprot:TRINITY_DN16398_c0_g1_i2.p1 TRINITY_DN16398_c0_g1~~TRINITY_DN16398_c0_g1_i2.p1  ORF type:complete len:252 (-),score=41.74 TRINITY_DN16398_c0_g1_i2:792-1547(-)